jgi:RNA polymerase sigma factor (sigma-70 family)
MLLAPMFQSPEARYNQWVRDHYRFLFRSAWALTGSRAMAEDAVQDCYTNAWKCREQLRDASLARPWLFQIMRRSIFRYLTPREIVQDTEAVEQEMPAADDGLDDRLDVVRALGRIAPVHREVLVLHYFDDMPTAQIAEALEIAPGTVLSRLARARAALKAAMGHADLEASSSNSNVTPLKRTRHV